MRFAYTKQSLKSFSKLDKTTQQRIANFTQELELLENPRIKGKALKGELSEYWRYRVGDYRLVCEIFDDKMLILCIKVDKRDSVYK
ncbi:type II toxin-antitoxin system RelE/ParE family toxin [Helicobacter sp. MIT 01-3238]|uniref:type II toxin-antitoxin system RelE family toxin n=1 Tax=Helicobacter sp. MIT 01-3238 TaxID=398627 RepID=UPI000E1F3E97|nr:type II toxin-antitoxin system RelE/ParE family toxin [Helicobacter sp. MIT 01-3238]RDU51740.1 type II toxin-antitoxin system RelE/ParE family toxin [Helicobacter sp. MIT 01-3238]